MLFSKLSLYLEQIFTILLCMAIPHDIYSWDLAVANDEGLDLFTIEGILESSNNSKTLSNLYAIAFDPVQQRFFVSVNGNNRSSTVYAFYLEKNTIVPLIPKTENDVQGLAYDAANDMLYWTDGIGHSIWWKNLKIDNAPSERLLTIETQVTMGIAVSKCHRAIVWANSDHNAASINRAEPDGSNHMEIVKEDTYLPTGVAIDEAYGKIYWTDDRMGIYYRIERCNLDGSVRELVLQRTHQEPFGLTVTGSIILWSDVIGRRIFSLSTDLTFPNHTKARLEPDIFYQYEQKRPFGVVAFQNETVSCEPVKVLHAPPLPNFNTGGKDNTLTSTEDASFCLNSGDLEGNRCHCKRGFSGARCEVPICYNHCLHFGTCYLSGQGYPECRCQVGYEGSRCERDVCNDYCLSGGRCLIEAGQPICSCPENVSGQRCEVTAIPHVEERGLSNDMALVVGLSSFGAMLLVAVIILTWRILVLRRRPRIKKRYIVNKPHSRSGLASAQPMTHATPPIEQCEITIENCCNMNICETPCFEPNVRTSRSSHKKTEDRKTLLKNMEAEPGISD